MKLFLLTQRENVGYDTYDSMVVAAENEGDAVAISPNGDIYGDALYCWNQWDCGTAWASKPDNVTCQYIGEAAPDIKAGPIITSFNAG